MTGKESATDLYRAFRRHEPIEVPLFFYHVPKAAGTTVNAVLFALAKFRDHICRFVPTPVGMRRTDPPRGLFGDPRVLVYSGHCWFGMHHRVPGPIHCATVLREPVERVASEYLWRSRHRDRVATAEAFEHYVRNVGLSNMATRLLSGESDIDWSSIERAVANLESCRFVGLTAELGAFVTAILTEYGGPNVKAPRAKEGRDPLKVELMERYGGMVADHNRYDIELYAAARRIQLERPGVTAALGEAAVTLRVSNPRGKLFDVG